MSEKGVLSKSIASNISEAIIDKLGGTGYAPTEWSRNINLLGIASADIENALASITEDTSSSDKGLLSLSIASDVGAMLNKKYNTSRGFKPCEVSSAVSALTVLPEKTASSAPICTFNDGADDVPIKSCEVALSPSLDGYSSVTVHHTDGQTPPVFSEDYTASLGRTIYGGTPDVVKGEGKEDYKAPITLNGSENWQKHGSLASWFYVDNLLVGAYANNSETGFITSSWGAQKAYSQVSSLANGEYAYGAINRFVIKNTDFTEVADFISWLASNPITLVCKSAEPTDFTFEPVPINSRLGNNTMWSEQGDMEVTYRADLDLYEAPSTLLGSNNTETEGNEEQEVNE